MEIHGGFARLAEQPESLRGVAVQELGPELDGHRHPGVAVGQDAAADAVARLEHGEAEAGPLELGRRRQPRGPRPHHGDIQALSLHGPPG